MINNEAIRIISVSYTHLDVYKRQDVGQGDGIFIQGPAGGTYLIDGGSSDIKKVGQYRIEPFLKSRGVGRLDYVLISHGDSDHMNGVKDLIAVSYTHLDVYKRQETLFVMIISIFPL